MASHESPIPCINTWKRLGTRMSILTPSSGPFWLHLQLNRNSIPSPPPSLIFVVHPCPSFARFYESRISIIIIFWGWGVGGGDTFALIINLRFSNCLLCPNFKVMDRVKSGYRLPPPLVCLVFQIEVVTVTLFYIDLHQTVHCFPSNSPRRNFHGKLNPVPSQSH